MKTLISRFISSFTLSFCLLLLPFFALAQGNPKHTRTPQQDTETPRDTASNSNAKKEKEDEPEFQRWYYGGNAWFGGYNDIFQIDLSPQIGYRLTPRFMVGAGVVLQPAFQEVVYTINGANKRDTWVYGRFGGDVFSRFQLLDWLFAHGELQYLEATYPVGINTTTSKVDYGHTPVPAAMLGLGAYSNLGPVRFYLMALYNFLYDANNVYDTNRSPIVLRGGIGFGF